MNLSYERTLIDAEDPQDQGDSELQPSSSNSSVDAENTQDLGDKKPQHSAKETNLGDHHGNGIGSNNSTDIKPKLTDQNLVDAESIQILDDSELQHNKAKLDFGEQRGSVVKGKANSVETDDKSTPSQIPQIDQSPIDVENAHQLVNRPMINFESTRSSGAREMPRSNDLRDNNVQGTANSTKVDSEFPVS